MNRRVAPFAAALIFAAVFAAVASPATSEAPDPATVVTAADLQAVMGGAWKVTATTDDSNGLVCEETDGYRVVFVFLHPANGKTVAEFVPAYREQGETVEEVAGIGDAAMYRPQYGEATAQMKGAESGEPLWLSIQVHNVEDTGARKKLAVDLLRSAAAKL